MTFSKDSLKNILSNPTRINYINGSDLLSNNDEDLFFTLFNNAPVGMVIIDDSSRVFKVNKKFFNYLEMPYHNVLNQNFGAAFSCNIYKNSREECGNTDACGNCQVYNCINDILLYNKSINNLDIYHQFNINGILINRWFLTSAVPLDYKDQRFILMTFIDITKRKRDEDQLTILGITDELTSLYNRRYLVNHCKIMISECVSSHRTMSFAIIDIDNFKHINDTYGHSVGDDVLVTFADTLRLNLRNCDLVGRYGGEEFIIALPNTPLNIANKVINRIQNMFKQLSYLRFNKPISFSAGLIQIPQDYDRILTFDEVLEKADALLYWAKNKDKGTIKAEICS